MAKKWAAQLAPYARQLHEMEGAADANMKTPAGPRYKASFEKTYRALVQECVRTDGSTVDRWEGSFEALTSVGTKARLRTAKFIRWNPWSHVCTTSCAASSKQRRTPSHLRRKLPIG